MTETIDDDAVPVVHGHKKIRSHLGMRGVAASMVVMYHIGFVTGFHFKFEGRSTIFGRSYLFVDLFFILSGFIISYANKADRHEAMTSGQALKFLKNRFARIYPLHFVCLYGFVLFNLAISIEGCVRTAQPFSDYWPIGRIVSLIAQTALVQSLGPPSWIDWNVPSWSISAEVFSYIAFIPLVILYRKNSYVQIVVLLITPILFYAHIHSANSSLDIISGIAPLRCLAGFSLGMLAFYFRHYLQPVPLAAVNLIQCASAAVAVCDLAMGWNDLIAVPAFALLVYSTWSDRGILSKILGIPAIQKLGEISYSVYLTHVPLISGLTFVFTRVAARLPWLSAQVGHIIFVGLVFGSVYAVANFTFVHIEQAGREWVLNLFDRGRHRYAESASGHGDMGFRRRDESHEDGDPRIGR